jgi:hypothetical protein
VRSAGDSVGFTVWQAEQVFELGYQRLAMGGVLAYQRVLAARCRRGVAGAVSARDRASVRLRTIPARCPVLDRGGVELVRRPGGELVPGVGPPGRHGGVPPFHGGLCPLPPVRRGPLAPGGRVVRSDPAGGPTLGLAEVSSPPS